jgi:branched-chain amino acid transport system permease protein
MYLLKQELKTFNKLKFYFLSFGLLIFLLLPIFVGDYQIYILTEFFIFSLFAISWNLLFRYTGMLSFGSAAFFSIGGYASGIIVNSLSNSPFSLILSLLGSMVLSAFVAFLIGYICTRSTDIYFSFLTLVFGMVVYSIIYQWRGLTGGDDGLLISSEKQLLGLELTNNGFYYWTLIVVTISIVIIWIITQSNFGQSIRAIRENSERALFIGLNVKKYRLSSFVISGVFVGIAGSLHALLIELVHPETSNWAASAEPILMSLLGGFKYFLGPVLGSGIYLFVKSQIMSFTEYWKLIVGSIFVLIVLFLPEGVGGKLVTLIKPIKPKKLEKEGKNGNS